LWAELIFKIPNPAGKLYMVAFPWDFFKFLPIFKIFLISLDDLTGRGILGIRPYLGGTLQWLKLW
jgi:hypothetical protein